MPPARKASAAAIKKFEESFTKNYGADRLIRTSVIKPYEVISTGSLTLDYRLGVGGLVEGRLHEIWGPDGVGKTTLLDMILAQAQRKHKGLRTALVDVEQKFDRSWAVAHGVDLLQNYEYPPENAEDVADAIKDMIRSGVFSVIGLDSIGAMIPEAEKEKDADQAVMAKQAQIITRMVKIAAAECRKSQTTVVMLNQVRANLSYGADTTTGGGFALKHVTTQKIKLRRTATSPYKVTIGTEKDRIVGHEIAAYVERNGVAPAYRTAILNLINVPTEKYGPIGVDQADEARTLGIDLKIIEQNGSRYTMLDGEVINGRDKVLLYLRDKPDMVAEIRERVLATVADEVHEETPPEEIEEGVPAFRTGAEANVS